MREIASELMKYLDKPEIGKAAMLSVPLFYRNLASEEYNKGEGELSLCLENLANFFETDPHKAEDIFITDTKPGVTKEKILGYVKDFFEPNGYKPVAYTGIADIAYGKDSERIHVHISPIKDGFLIILMV